MRAVGPKACLLLLGFLFSAEIGTSRARRGRFSSRSHLTPNNAQQELLRICMFEYEQDRI